MPYSARWVKQLFRELPEDPEDLLRPGGSNYSDPGFLRLFFDWLDQLVYEDPQAALEWARVAPRLTRPETSSCEDRIRAYKVLGATCRALGRHAESDAHYRTAFKLAESEEIAWKVRADLLRRLANLRVAQGRPKEALELVRVLHGLEGLARFKVLLCRGNALLTLERFSEALACYGQILAEIKLTSKSPVSPERLVHEAAAINVGYVVKEGTGPEACWTALGYVAKAKKLTRHRPSLPLYQLQWIEGLIWDKLRSYGTPTGFSLAREAEQALQRALRGFLHLRVPWEIALVSLDLARLYRDLGRWDELLELSLETLQRFRVLSGDTRAVVALGLVVDAVRAQANVMAVIVAAGDTLRQRHQGARRQAPKRVRVEAPTAPPPVGRSNLSMVRKRRKLLEAAHEEIERGFRLRAILKRAGVNRATFYHHFGDHEGCAVAVVDEHMHSRVMDWLRRVDATDPLRTLTPLLEEAPLLAALPNGLAADRLEKLGRDWRRGLAEKLAAGQEEGKVRAGVDPEETAAYLIAGLRARDPVCLRGIRRYLEMLKP